MHDLENPLRGNCQAGISSVRFSTKLLRLVSMTEGLAHMHITIYREVLSEELTTSISMDHAHQI